MCNRFDLPMGAQYVGRRAAELIMFNSGIGPDDYAEGLRVSETTTSPQPLPMVVYDVARLRAWCNGEDIAPCAG